MSSYQGPASPRTPGLIPPSPNRPPLHPGTALTPRSASRKRESPRGTPRITSGQRASSLPADVGNAASPKQTTRDNFRYVVNSQSGLSSPSESRARRRQGDSPGGRDKSPISLVSSAGSEDRSVRHRAQSSDRLSLTKSMDKSVPRKSGESSVSSSVNGFLVLGKSFNALLLLLGGIILGALLVTGGVDWIFSDFDGTSPLLSCPGTSELLGSTSALDGSSCEIRFTFNSYSSYTSSVAAAFVPYNTRGLGAGFQCSQSAAYTSCSSSALCLMKCLSQNTCATTIGSGTCTSAGFLWGSGYSSGAPSTCTQTIGLSGQGYVVSGASLAASPFCSSNVALTPGGILVLRGMLLAVLGMVIIVAGSLAIKAKVAPFIRTTVTSQKGLLIAKASASELRSTLEARWDTEYKIAKGGSLGSLSPTGAAAVHPAKHFASSSWKYRVRVMHAMMRKRRSGAVWVHVKRTMAACTLFVGLVFAASAFLLYLLPGTYPTGDPIIAALSDGASGSWTIGASLFAPIYGSSLSSGVWVDILVLADLFVDIVIVFLASLLLKWEPLASDREKRRLSQLGASEEACLVLLVSAGTCLRGGLREKLLTAIESGLSDLRFGSVFVLDQGVANAPLDDTWKFATGIDPLAVHYVYLPGTHKQLALYWLSQIWMPFLHKKGKLNKLARQMVVVDLDRTALSVDIGGMNKMLIEEEQGRVLLVPTCSTSALPSSSVSSWESRRLFGEFYHRMTEVGITGGTVLRTSPSEPFAIWDRQAVDIAAADPVQTALTALKRRGAVHVAVASGIEATPNFHSIYWLYASQAQTVSNMLSYLRELFLCLSSLVHGPSVRLKLFIVLGPIVTWVCLVLRPLIIGSLVFRDPLGLVVLLAAFWTLSILTSSLHAFSQWRGNRTKDLGSHLNKASIITYPIYQLYLGSMELGLAVAGCTFGRMKDETDRPYWASLKELYPCPPHPEVDWFTIWRTSDSTRLSVLSSALDASQLASPEDTFTSVV